jgi:uncharacterized lipoprotein NlpE involved in copper resistance
MKQALTILAVVITLAGCGKAATTAADVVAETVLDAAIELADAVTEVADAPDAASPADAATAASDVTATD